MKPSAPAHGHHRDTGPVELVIACRCADCDGDLRGDSVGKISAQLLLVCSVCRCAYRIETSTDVP